MSSLLIGLLDIFKNTTRPTEHFQCQDLEAYSDKKKPSPFFCLSSLALHHSLGRTLKGGRGEGKKVEMRSSLPFPISAVCFIYEGRVLAYCVCGGGGTGWDMGKLALILLFLPDGISNSESEFRNKRRRGKGKLLNFKYDWTDAHTGSRACSPSLPPSQVSPAFVLLLGIVHFFMTYCTRYAKKTLHIITKWNLFSTPAQTSMCYFFRLWSRCILRSARRISITICKCFL